ncbi:hypothetical protein [Archangium sp.]|nr:hypothetical protein [Archangium sp.]HYO57826.1 hypothetical protein [Archangium sp.]
MAVTDVLVSSDYLKGRAVPIDKETLGTQAVRLVAPCRTTSS